MDSGERHLRPDSHQATQVCDLSGFTVEKVASDLGLGGGFRRALRFPPPLIAGKSRISHNLA